MNDRVNRWLVAVLLAVGIIGCGPGGVAPSTAPPTAPSTAPTPSPIPASTASLGPSGARSITMEDNGRSITLAVGDRLLLMLGSDFDWTVLPVDARVVALLPDGSIAQGAQGAYEAVGAGTVTLSATGDPSCRKATPPCGAPSILFEVTLVVR